MSAAPQEVRAGRFKGSWLTLNRDMGPAQIRDYCRLTEVGDRLMRDAVEQLQLSGRAYHRVLKLARTIADLAHDVQIATDHLVKALQYCPMETVV